jgi:alpha-N-arabinofuranosidase
MVQGSEGASSITATSLWNEDFYATNTLHDQTRVSPRANETVAVADDGRLSIQLPCVSWTVIEIAH